MSEEEKDRLRRERLEEKQRRLFKWADQLGIPVGPDRERQTLWALVGQSIPELKECERDGARRKWDAFARITLAHLVTLEMHVSEGTKAQACAALAKSCPWLSNVKGNPDGDALARQCTAEDLRTARKALKDSERAGMLDDFIAWVRSARDHLAQSTEQK